LIEMWIEDPDGTRIALVEVPADHPLRVSRAQVSPAVSWACRVAVSEQIHSSANRPSAIR
jgi:hypothetical protein